MKEKMQELVGKEIRQIFVDAERQHWIRFITDEGALDYQVWGDCCSESWIWSVSSLWYFSRDQQTHVPKVKEIRAVELPVSIQRHIAKDGLCRQDEESVYSYFIQGEYGGGVEINFRNSSNGYYGGEIGDLAQAPEKTKWVEVPNTYGDEYIADQRPRG